MRSYKILYSLNFQALLLNHLCHNFYEIYWESTTYEKLIGLQTKTKVRVRKNLSMQDWLTGTHGGVVIAARLACVISHGCSD